MHPGKCRTMLDRISPITHQTLSSALQLSLARAPGVAYTTFLCIFATLATLGAVMLRACGNPAIAGSGLLLQFVGAITIILGQFVWPARVLWETVRPDGRLSLNPYWLTPSLWWSGEGLERVLRISSSMEPHCLGSTFSDVKVHPQSVEGSWKV